ncbi:MAG: hypothetical protein KJO32_05325, partial [Deltaproteobacteria bacterium]|nr:hypothetical protein [Deltaproteobacteria bacterium]
CRSLYYLSCGNLIGKLLRQNSYFGHDFLSIVVDRMSLRGTVTQICTIGFTAPEFNVSDHLWLLLAKKRQRHW